MAKLTRPLTTMFLNTSVDGRVTSDDSDDIDSNKDWKKDPKIRAWIQPFFEFSGKDTYTLTYGDRLIRLGLNTRQGTPKKMDFNLIVIDQDPDLNAQACLYLAQNVRKLYLITPDNHPITKEAKLPKNLYHISYPKKIDLKDLMKQLKTKHKIKAVTIQSYAPFNARWFSEGLVDHLSLIMSPLLVGPFGTPPLVLEELKTVKQLVFQDMQVFGANFVNLRYDVINR